ncbi:MAG: Hsp20/alpha crystallin family protein [Planctomycetota bacterium]|nr:Hsp20/alpha crystallin family protein [Planctomycetota bacterium]
MNCEMKNGCATVAEPTVAKATPACDVWEGEDGVHVVAEMPGVDAAAVEITIERDVLSIRGKACLPRASSRAEGEMDAVATGYVRAFHLTDTADAGAIQASCKDGLVRLLVPRKQPAQRKIAVSTG